MSRVGRRFFEVFILFLHLGASEEPEPGRDGGGSCGSPWVGSHLPCLRRVPAAISARVACSTPRHAPEGAPTPGRRLCRCTSDTFGVRGAGARAPGACGCDRNLCGQRPHPAGKRTGTGPGDDGGVLAACPQAPGALPAPDLGLPTDVREDLGLVCQAPWPRPP